VAGWVQRAVHVDCGALTGGVLVRPHCSLNLACLVPTLFSSATCWKKVAFSASTLLVGRQEGHLAGKNRAADGRWALVSPDGVAPSRMVGVSASVNLPLHHKSISSLLAPAHPGCPGKRAVKWLWLFEERTFVGKWHISYRPDVLPVTNSKHCRQRGKITSWSHPFFIQHWTHMDTGVALFINIIISKLLLSLKKFMEYEVEGSRPRVRPKRTWREVVQKRLPST